MVIHQPPITPRVFSVVQIRPNQAISVSYSYNSSVKRYAIHSNPHSDSQPGVQTICILFMPNHFGDKIEHAFLLSQETYSRKGNFWHQHIVLWIKRIFENLSPTFEIIPTSWEISHEFLCQGFGAHRDIMNRRKTWTANDLWRGLGVWLLCTNLSDSAFLVAKTLENTTTSRQNLLYNVIMLLLFFESFPFSAVTMSSSDE